MNACSFDESCADYEAATNVDCLRVEKSDNSGGSKHSPLTGRHCSVAVPPQTPPPPPLPQLCLFIFELI
ncbi:hypothetical protein WUBG_18801 [Wuchereria bancrofti]|uniref:Uncharacterized protein n=1 Tax=Wuchereria bancrofti TaxID=6293 RepID=J9DKZ7_WUCBA|nr:hypothetical protein WUBG_18801 [Wuchereria bancrofti]